MVTDYQKIKNVIEKALDEGKRDFIIYPYGEYGVMTKQILNNSFGIQEKWIIDNKLSKYNFNIKNLDFCKSLEHSNYIVLFTCVNPDVYDEVRGCLSNYFQEENIIDIFKNVQTEGKVYTKCGKYSYGPLCNHWLVESVGAFCGFAIGSDVVHNHPLSYISTHPSLHYGGIKMWLMRGAGVNWNDLKEHPAYFSLPGINPKGDNYKLKRIKIGNDVWLGKNVIITNSSNIGNGVIAGAGAIITKDIPDYTVVVGAPAKIVRYRYTKEQIEALNKIAWWNWEDEKIRECYDDFYLSVDEFIQKYL